jgi:hypothetical protein
MPVTAEREGVQLPRERVTGRCPSQKPALHESRKNRLRRCGADAPAALDLRFRPAEARHFKILSSDAIGYGAQIQSRIFHRRLCRHHLWFTDR